MNLLNKRASLLIFLLFFFFPSLAIADEYYSSSDSYLNGSDKILHAYQFFPSEIKRAAKVIPDDRRVSIQISGGKIKFSEKTKFSEEVISLLNPEKPAKLSEDLSPVIQFFLTKENQAKLDLFQKREEKSANGGKTSQEDQKEFETLQIEIKRLQSTPLYNIQYLLTDTKAEIFFVKSGRYYYYIQTDEKVSNGTNIFDPVNEEIRTVEYRVLKAVKSDGKTIESVAKFPEILLKKRIDSEGRLLGFQIVNHSFFYIYKVENEQLSTYAKERSERVTEVKEFSFAKDTLYLTYLENRENEEKRLFIEYKMSGKKNNLIQINMKAPVSLFDPDNVSTDMEENIGFLGDVKGKDLVEMKKTQLINGEADTKWVNNLKLPVLSVVYKTESGWDKKLWSKSEDNRYLGIEGLWYMVSWMNQYNVTQKKVTFLNGSVATDFTVYNSAKESNGDNIFEFVKMEKVVYRFTLDKPGFVRKFEFPAENQSVILEEIENTTTRKNKEFLSEYVTQNNIVLIKNMESNMEKFLKEYKF